MPNLGFTNELSVACVKSEARQAKLLAARKAEAALAWEARQYQAEVGHRFAARQLQAMRSRCSGVVAEVARALLAKHAYDLDVAAAAFHADPAAYSFHHSAQAPLAGPAHILGEKEPEPELEPLEDEPVSGVPSVDELRQQRAAFFARQNRPPTTLLTVSTSGSTSSGHEADAAAGQLAHNLSQSLSRIRSASSAAHLKVQLPNGAVISRTFAAEAEMCDVYDWVTGSQEVSEQEVDPKRLVGTHRLHPGTVTKSYCVRVTSPPTTDSHAGP